jgi:hypothetical protein
LHPRRGIATIHQATVKQRTKETAAMHLCLVCNARPAADETAAFCDDVCATAWEQNACDALVRIQAAIAAEEALGPSMADAVLDAHAAARVTGLWN